jgi:hypothetical protein
MLGETNLKVVILIIAALEGLGFVYYCLINEDLAEPVVKKPLKHNSPLTSITNICIGIVILVPRGFFMGITWISLAFGFALLLEVAKPMQAKLFSLP